MLLETLCYGCYSSSFSYSFTMQSSALPSDHRPQPRPSRLPFRTPVNLPPRLVPANSSHFELRRTAPSWLPPPPPPPLEAYSYEDGRSSKRKINDRLLHEDFESRDSAHPKTLQFRYKPIKNYEKMDQLVGQDQATGRLAAGPRERQRHWARDVEDVTPLESTEHDLDNENVEQDGHEA